jgi:hypothetical protein
MNEHESVRAHLLKDLVLDALPPPASIEYVHRCQSQIVEFDRYRRNRLAGAFYRYRHNLTGGTREPFDVVRDAIHRLREYLVDGNLEHLVDAANLCGLEFMDPKSHPAPHFSAQDDGIHTPPIE